MLGIIRRLEMEVRYGKKFENRTSRFLLPAIISGHGKIFKLKISDIYILATGLDDRIIWDNKKYDFLSERRPVFILIDKFINKRKVEDFLYWLKFQSFYLGEYPIDMAGRAYMIIIDTPEAFHISYDNFILGRYSEMYTLDQLDELFKDREDETYLILIKDTSKLLPKFVKKLEETFNTTLKYTDFITAEMDLPYKLSEKDEIFNYELTL